jgi:3-dehydroquinate dehydratase type I
MTYLASVSSPYAEARLSDRICVSVYGRTVSELKRAVRSTLAFYPCHVELRLDYLFNFERSLHDVANLGTGPNRILTFRSRREGGVSRVSDFTRKLLLTRIISEISPGMIDVEINTLDEFHEVSDLLKDQRISRKTNLIASSHDFDKTEDSIKLENLVLNAVRRYSPSVVKIVRQANKFEDNFKILSLYRMSEKISPTRLIAFCSGPLGIFSRIVCVSYGSPFTFASLPRRATAQGQLDVKTMKILFDSWSVKQK